MKIRLSSPLQIDSCVDGEGIRSVIWTQGCPHHCKGCHNPKTHSFTGGYEASVSDLINEIESLEGQDGITFSGGDPMIQPIPCTIIAKRAKELNYNVWCYTGFDFEELLERPECVEFLKYIDVLVDGKFIMDLKSYDAMYRGSTNQRIINVSSSLKKKRAVTIKKYKNKKSVLI